MDSTHNMGSGPQQRGPTNKKGWNLAVDLETHQALEILGAAMIGKEKMHKDIKESVQIPKSKIIKLLVLEKLDKLGLLKSSEVARVK